MSSQQPSSQRPWQPGSRGYPGEEVAGFLWLRGWETALGRRHRGAAASDAVDALARPAQGDVERGLTADVRAGAMPPRGRHLHRATLARRSAARVAREAVSPSAWRARGPWLALAASATVAAAGLLIVPWRSGAPHRPVVVALHHTVTRSPVRVALAPRIEPGTRASAGPAARVRSAPNERGHPTPPLARAAAERFAISFGAFRNPVAAAAVAHRIRSDGYIVRTVPAGALSAVVTPPYRTRAQAQRLASALRTIGLPARLVVARTL